LIETGPAASLQSRTCFVIFGRAERVLLSRVLEHPSLAKIALYLCSLLLEILI